jgi:hypothetical protein
MKNKHTISFYHPKACQPETSATRFTPTKRCGYYEYHPPLYIILIIHIY